MACACKVAKNINDIQKYYGVKNNSVKTDIKGKIKLFLKKIVVGGVCLFFSPFFLIFLIIRKIITNKPLSITRLIKKKNNVRN
jgi:hypothetical protein